MTCECGKIFTESYSFRKHKETHIKKGRVDRCEECGKLFKSDKAKSKHIQTYHTSLSDEGSLVETSIQCTLCNLKSFTIDSIKFHLITVHKIAETASNAWESYIKKVEFQMEVTQDSSGN